MSRSRVVIPIVLLLMGVFVIIQSGVFVKEHIPPQYSYMDWLPFWTSTTDDNRHSVSGTNEYLITLSLKCWHILAEYFIKTVLYVATHVHLYLRPLSVMAVVVLLSYMFLRFRKNANMYKRQSETSDLLLRPRLNYEYDSHPDARRYWKRCAIKVAVAFLVVSFMWEFVRIYQIERAKQATVLFKGMPAECLPHKLSWWQAVRLWTLSLMSWDQQDICESYHLALLVDPLWHVTPPKVLTSAFTLWLPDLMPKFSSAIGQSFQQLFGKLPVQWQPVVFLFGVIVTVLLLLMSCGYRISSPFFGIEHGSHGKGANISCCCPTRRAAIKDH